MKLKNVSNQMLQIAVTTGVLAALFSCQRMQFAPVSESLQTSLAIPVDPIVSEPPVLPPTPVVPPVIPPPVVIPKPLPVLSNGACAIDSSTTLSACQKCNVPLNPPAPPQFSQKGQSLIDVMAIGCSIPNNSAPQNYVAPTKDQLISRLNRLSPSFYPDSAMSAAQISTIEGLKVSSSLQQKMFGGLWYQPPYSDAFETYFGLEVKEAVYQLCYQSTESTFTPVNTTVLQSKAMFDCIYNQGFGCKESPAYVAGNVYRNQLRSGMTESIQNPYVAPKPTPSKVCSWEKFDGLYELGGAEQIAKWLVSSQKISMEVKGVTGRCSLINKLPAGSDIPTGEVILSAYICK